MEEKKNSREKTQIEKADCLCRYSCLAFCRRVCPAHSAVLSFTFPCALSLFSSFFSLPPFCFRTLPPFSPECHWARACPVMGFQPVGATHQNASFLSLFPLCLVPPLFSFLLYIFFTPLILVLIISFHPSVPLDAAVLLNPHFVPLSPLSPLSCLSPPSRSLFPSNTVSY